jgi:hypothetical protein
LGEIKRFLLRLRRYSSGGKGIPVCGTVFRVRHAGAKK